MSYQHKPDSGSIFKNTDRQTETQPHAKGSALVGGVEYWVNVWNNVTKSGEKYQSFKFKRKDEVKPEPKPAPVEDFDDDFPF